MGKDVCFSHVYNELSTVVNVEQVHFHCSSEGISTTFILSCTTWMCFQMNCSVTPQVPFDMTSQHPQEAKWLKFRDPELFDSSFLKTFPSTTEMGFLHQLNCSSILHSKFTVPLAGLWLWEYANCKYRSQHAICNCMAIPLILIMVSPYKWQSYLPILGHEIALA